jgi:hypothetical protein
MIDDSLDFLEQIGQQEEPEKKTDMCQSCRKRPIRVHIYWNKNSVKKKMFSRYCRECYLKIAQYVQVYHADWLKSEPNR